MASKTPQEVQKLAKLRSEHMDAEESESGESAIGDYVPENCRSLTKSNTTPTPSLTSRLTAGRR